MEAEVAAGSPGDRLSSVRELMARHQAGPATVQRAIAALVARGVVEARPGRGTFVAPRVAPAAADTSWQTVALGARAIDADALETLLRPPAEDAFVLSSGYLPADLQPTAALGAALARAARRPGAWDRVPPEGIAPLRAYFAAEVGAAPGEVLICPGGQAGLAACLRGLAAPGAPVVVEAPTYLGALAAARAQGLVPVPVPADERGIRPDLLADALERSGARLVYLQPVFANPHGATLDNARRAAVLEVVRAAGAFLIEDDAFRELAIATAPPPLFGEDPDGHVVHVRSLTKPAAPGLRISAVIARGPALARLRAARIVEDLYVPGPMQEAALELVGTPAWRAHLRRLRRVLRERRDALATAWGQPVRLPQGGMNLWVALEPGIDDRDVAQRAAAAGVIVSPGRPFFAGEPPGPFLRLTYASEPPDRLATAVERLRPLLKP
ncbi:PLP-dependent aminotransferase family protein [Solirubrobacter ginsenosidimutans]|uniref:PLP-dependent aminotransferase family protein n=1 Tax=Solirubrobacter ginsenosidimutans TaxID=490573 RepID=A0A9X3RZZ3_9ACTN|nr:PLP-dependent aminotransferase family protein [Solirubrobacter ginsenosidimutans]MDA0161460.1 PLP-dependent aminotransferase family protein [Solirubrobacter ginsenosidimutans]